MPRLSKRAFLVSFMLSLLATTSAFAFWHGRVPQPAGNTVVTTLQGAQAAGNTVIATQGGQAGNTVVTTLQ